jgi:hypothetical protein
LEIVMPFLLILIILSGMLGITNLPVFAQVKDAPMTKSLKTVATLKDLVSATGDGSVQRIMVIGTITGAPSIRLAPGQQLVGQGTGAGIVFISGVDGLQLTSANTVCGLKLETQPDKRAIFNDTSVSTFATITLTDVTTVGQVQIIARDGVRGGHVSVDGLDVIAADARTRADRPHGYGVHVLQGAFTLWNLQPDPEVVVTAELLRISLGRDGTPVLGGGVFVSGHSDAGGRLKISRLETGPVFSNGKLAVGTANMITAGVFVLYGTSVDVVRNRGPVNTYGVNDMVLDSWGIVDRWIAEAPITSHGPSGVGFVNFGTMNQLCILAPIETFGAGARGFNVYTGQVATAEFHSITTHGDAGVGVQVSKPLGRLSVHHGIKTQGGTGPSLVKGVIKQLPAYAISVLEGSVVGEIAVTGGVSTQADEVTTLNVQGEIRAMRINDGIRAYGKNSNAVVVEGGVVPLTNLEMSAENGAAVRLRGAHITALLGVIAHGSAGDLVVESDSKVVTDATATENLESGFGNAFKVSGPGRLDLHPFGP